jgi:large subunit ribosomal protein L21
MYAIIRDGCHQMRVQQGDTVRLAYREGAEADSTISLDEVLLVGEGAAVQVGAPLVAGASVQARIKGHGRGRKIVVYKYKRRKNFHKKQGHRQPYTEAVIEAIQAPSA